MAYLSSSPFSLAGVLLQIDPSGVNIGGLQQVDVSEQWLSRATILAARDADDAKPFEIVSITGARSVGSFAPTHDVPVNDEAAIDDLYKKILYRNITLKGSTMDNSDYASILTAYDAAQIYWLSRQKILDKLSAQDIPYSKIQSLASEYSALTKPLISLVTPLLSCNVTFAQGDSCSFAQAFENHVNSFSFSVIQEVA